MFTSLMSRLLRPVCARLPTSLRARCLVQVGYRWAVFSIWGRLLLVLLATKQLSGLLCVPYGFNIEKGVGNVCSIFFCLTYVEP